MLSKSEPKGQRLELALERKACFSCETGLVNVQILQLQLGHLYYFIKGQSSVYSDLHQIIILYDLFY